MLRARTCRTSAALLIALAFVVAFQGANFWPGAASSLVSAHRHNPDQVIANASRCFEKPESGVPAKGHDHSSHCCVFCAPTIRDDAILLAIAVDFILAPSAFPAGFASFLLISIDRAMSAEGWASSWSSRAPPYFS